MLPTSAGNDLFGPLGAFWVDLAHGLCIPALEAIDMIGNGSCIEEFCEMLVLPDGWVIAFG